MSLKLGNTNIAGTQVLYSTTGSNTDGAMTQNATTTQLNLKANDADVVHKTGNETISGVKTFTNHIEKQVNVVRGQAPSEARYEDIKFVDNNSNWLAGLEYALYQDKSSTLGIYLFDSVNNATDIKTYISFNLDSNGNTSIQTPASDVNNSIVTTVNKYKSENGYFQLGNGLIINWGRTSNTQQTNVTFSKAYSSASSYAVVAVPYTSSNSNQDGYSCYVTNLSSTGCTIWNKMYGSSISAIKHWIAIGY